MYHRTKKLSFLISSQEKLDLQLWKEWWRTTRKKRKRSKHQRIVLILPCNLTKGTPPLSFVHLKRTTSNHSAKVGHFTHLLILWINQVKITQWLTISYLESAADCIYKYKKACSPNWMGILCDREIDTKVYLLTNTDLLKYKKLYTCVSTVAWIYLMM